MAHEIPIQTTSLIAAADFSTKQYFAVKIDSSGQAALAGAGENAIGLIQGNPGAGDIAEIMVVGESKAVYGGTVTAGQNLTPDALGRLVVASGTDAVIAVAKTSGVINDVQTVYLTTRTASGVNTKSVLSIPVILANVADGDILTTFTPGFAGAITKFSFAVTDPVTTAAKTTTLNLEIGTTNVTGGVLTITSANATPLGAVVDGTAITANNVFGATDSISIEATATTAFIEGEGVLLIVLG